MTSVLLLVAALLSQTQTGTPTEAVAQPQKPSSNIVLLPILTYNSDTGLGIGVAGEFFWYGANPDPQTGYAHRLSAQVMFTTGGVQSHFFTYDGPHLLGPVRLEAHLEFNKDLYAPYYGPGNQSLAGVAIPSDNKFTSYKSTFPVAWIRFSARPFGDSPAIEPFLEYRYQSTSVDPYADSLLTQQNPIGLKGGHTSKLIVGFLHDTRDSETVTTSGGVEEIATALALPKLVSDYTYGVITLSERRFFSLWTRRLVLAGRVMFDAQIGESPFFEWNRIDGIEDTDGIGGMSTVRGVPRDRYQGKVKLVANAELRFLPFSFHAFGRDLDLGGVAFYDIGRVWHPGSPQGDGYLALWHPGAGGGLRFVAGDAVVRLDVGEDLSLHRLGVYFAFGQQF
jgi:hypothetical protein